MANIASAQKKNRQMIVNRARNRAAMSTVRTAIKKARMAVDGKSADAEKLVKAAISTVDKAATKDLIKKNTAARYVSRLSVRGKA